ncbi:hypothetical protein [Clostridium butyricum]|uniref:hypothetical protein n=1 Tax=Clostridium butyricum TaxID=1492 RepID=UPI0024B8FADE|nr:hypothetical protein [Clostridium butyricum]
MKNNKPIRVISIDELKTEYNLDKYFIEYLMFNSVSVIDLDKNCKKYFWKLDFINNTASLIFFKRIFLKC